MRKHEGFTPCEGAGRIRPQARDHRAQGRTAVLSARHRLFRKANVHRREPQVPQEQSGHREFQVYRESQGCRESQALIIRGGHARNRVVFINTGRRGHCPKAVVTLTWPYACGRSRRPSASGEKRPARALQEPHIDENLPISGRSPQFFCHEGSRGVLARANARIEPNSAARSKARGRPGCAPKVGQVVDRAIEAARQGQAAQATRIALEPNRVFGRYVDVALAWGVISRSNGIPYPDAIKHLFTVPL